jgi:hypothetical protein
MSLRRKPARWLMMAASVALVSSTILAQFNPFDRGGRFRGRRGYDRDNVIYKETEYGRELAGAKNDWEIDERFEHDAFRFARVKYTEDLSDRRAGGPWTTDFPESDLNLPHRLRELTSMEVHPESVIVELTDENLSDYPFLYIVEPGNMTLTEGEVAGLRRYLLNGGFLMVDDFWGEAEWHNLYVEIRRVFPDREPVELPLEHPIFHCVYDLKEKPQIPSIGLAQAGRISGRTWERPDAETPHYKAIFDNDGRMAVIICHNTDLGDGWEREGEDPWYFHQFSEKYAYPLGINIVTYAMTH